MQAASLDLRARRARFLRRIRRELVDAGVDRDRVERMRPAELLDTRRRIYLQLMRPGGRRWG